MLRPILGVAAVALVVVPAFAGDVPDYVPASSSPLYSPASMITADVAIGGGYFSGGGGTGEALANGRVNIPLPWGRGLNEEIEVAGLWAFDGSYDAVGVFSHTYVKNPNRALGVLLGAESLNGNGAVTAGVEGIVFFPSSAVAGFASHTWASGFPDFWSFGGEARFYLTPNDKVTVGAGVNTGGGTNWWLMAGYDHRFTGTRLNAFTTLGYTPTGGNWEWLVGARVNFDQPNSTLQSHDFEVPFNFIAN